MIMLSLLFTLNFTLALLYEWDRPSWDLSLVEVLKPFTSFAKCCRMPRITSGTTPIWEHLIPQASLIDAESLESETPSTAFPFGMLVSKKSFKSSLTMPSLTELMLDKASPAVLKGKKPIKLTTDENLETSLTASSTCGRKAATSSNSRILKSA